MHQMLISGSIAGAKWAIHLSLAWFVMGDKKWIYFREMGVICAAGSAILIPYILSVGGGEYFLGSLIACVVVIAGFICWRFPRIGLNKSWVLLWFGLLTVAVTLQITLVFKVHV